MIKEKINILAISAGNTGGISFHRIMIPFNYLMEHNNDFNIIYAPDEAINLDAPNLDNVNIVHFHANITYNKPLMDKLFSMQKKGCKLIMDIDDYPIIPKHNPAYEGYMKKLHTPIINTIKRVNAISTTTKLFATELKKIFKGKIIVFPNVLDRQFEQFIPRPTQSKRLRIGLVGSASHFKDYELLKGMVKQLKSYKDQIQFVNCGFSININEANQELNPWNDIERILTDDYSTISEDYKDYLFRYYKEDYPLIDNEPYKRVWAKSIGEYGKIYNEIDILLAPLVNDKFNQMKSELKIVEAGNFGKVFIGSPVGQYKEVIKHGVNGLLIINNKWADAIGCIINNRELGDYMRVNLNDMINKKYDIDKWNYKRIKFYKELV